MILAFARLFSMNIVIPQVMPLDLGVIVKQESFQVLQRYLNTLLVPNDPKIVCAILLFFPCHIIVF